MKRRSEVSHGILAGTAPSAGRHQGFISREETQVKKRVVITGMGVVAPNAHGLEAFTQALREGRIGYPVYSRTPGVEFCVPGRRGSAAL